MSKWSGKEAKFIVIVVLCVVTFYPVDSVWNFEKLDRISRLHRGGGGEDFMAVN